MAATVQTYRIATSRVETAARGRAAGSWAVVLDADETVINNTPYQAGLALEGARHTPERFTAWVRKKGGDAGAGRRGLSGSRARTWRTHRHRDQSPANRMRRHR
jgi:predicted secreted acid phosphatase